MLAVEGGTSSSSLIHVSLCRAPASSPAVSAPPSLIATANQSLSDARDLRDGAGDDVPRNALPPGPRGARPKLEELFRSEALILPAIEVDIAPRRNLLRPCRFSRLPILMKECRDGRAGPRTHITRGRIAA